MLFRGVENESGRQQAPEKNNGTYVLLPVNDEQRFKNLIGLQTTVLEVGCGVHPRCSVVMTPQMAWIGCDPQAAVSKINSLVQIQTLGPGKVIPDHMAFFNMEADSIMRKFPIGKPKWTILVAPNPMDVIDRGLLYELKLDASGQGVIIVLDRTSEEVKLYRDEVASVLKKWAKDNNLERIEYKPTFFIPNSTYLISLSKNTLFIFQKR
jgi:hypothetical protein